MPLPLAWVVPWSECVVREKTPEGVVASAVRIWSQGEIVERQRDCARLHQRYFAYPPGNAFAHYVVDRLLERAPAQRHHRRVCAAATSLYRCHIASHL